MNLDPPFKILWVESGRPVPRYAIRNFKLTNVMHAQFEQYLISEQEIEFEFMNHINLNTVPTSEKTNRFLELQKKWPHKQEYFWLGTTKRFFHLYDVMSYYNFTNVLHLETDCILLEPEAISKYFLSRNDFRMAYPLQAKGIGCASILLIKSTDVLGQFLDLVLEKWQLPNVDDMTLLGDFALRDEVLILPTWPNQADDVYFFDAQSIGKYFHGTDARNCRIPFSFRGIQDEREGSVFAEFIEEKLKWRCKSFAERISIRLEVGNQVKTLVNLHLHSKHISKSRFLMLLMLRLGFGPRTPVFWKLGFLDITVCRERFLSFCYRRILGRINFDEKNLR